MVALSSTSTHPDMLVTTYLEMTSRAEFRPAYISGAHFTIEPMAAPDVDFYRFLYKTVGEPCCWRDRLALSDNELYAILSDPRVTVDVLYVGGVPAGYVEVFHGEEATEIAYFGLRSAYHGCGYGKHLLSHGIARAWERGARRVWVHTCNLDGPYALKNYMKRGFRIFDVTEEPMPERYM